MLLVETSFPTGTRPADLAFGDLRVTGDAGAWSTDERTRIQLVVSFVGMIDQLLAWCSSGGSATLTSFEAKRLLTVRDVAGGRVEVSTPDRLLHVARDRREVCLAFHRAALRLVDDHPDMSWSVARDDFWAVLSDFRSQCLPGYVEEG